MFVGLLVILIAPALIFSTLNPALSNNPIYEASLAFCTWRICAEMECALGPGR